MEAEMGQRGLQRGDRNVPQLGSWRLGAGQGGLTKGIEMSHSLGDGGWEQGREA